MDAKLTGACYAIAKLIYPDSIKKKDAVALIYELKGNIEVSDRSLLAYIDNFFRMMSGDELGRKMSGSDVKYYLDRIYGDYGKDFLENALKSLRTYLDKNSDQNCPKLEKIIEEFESKCGF